MTIETHYSSSGSEASAHSAADDDNGGWPPQDWPETSDTTTDSGHWIEAGREPPTEEALERLRLEHEERAAELEPEFTPPSSPFKPFLKLPAELRLKIWKKNLPGPRIVVVTYNRDDINDFRSTTTIPANLHVCHESRVEARKIYKLCFAYEIFNDPYAPPPMTYFNYELDTVVFARPLRHHMACEQGVSNCVPNTICHLRSEDLRGIQKMMVVMSPKEMWDFQVDDVWERYGHLKQLPNLQTLSTLLAQKSLTYPDMLNGERVMLLDVDDRDLGQFQFWGTDCVSPGRWTPILPTAQNMQVKLDDVIQTLDTYIQRFASITTWTPPQAVHLARMRGNKGLSSIYDLRW